MRWTRAGGRTVSGLVRRRDAEARLIFEGDYGAGEPLAFLICDKCGAVSEQTSPALRSAIDALAEEASFKRRTQVIELTGTCASCRPA